MTARHSSSRPRQNPAARKVGLVGAIAIGVVLLLGLLVAGISKLVSMDDGGSCGDRKNVSLAVEPSIEPQVRSLVDRVSSKSCYAYSVEPMSSADFSQRISSRAGLPDLWIPDSAVRLDQASQDAQVPFTTVLNSLATTPVVVARKGTDADLGSWTSAISTRGLKIGDPSSSGTADAPILAATSEAENGRTSKDSLRAAMAALAQGQSGQSTPPSESQLVADVAAAGGAAIVSEQKALQFTKDHADAGVTLAVPKSGAVFLTYPLAVSAQETGRRDVATQAAGPLRDAAIGQEFVDQLKNDGFRGADRAPIADRPGVGEVTPVVVRDPNLARSAIQRWKLLSLPTRGLVLLDTSGSMATPVAGTNKTRVQLLAETASAGLGMFPNAAQVGFWAFSTGANPADKPYREVAPIMRLDAPEGDSTHRQVLAANLPKLPAMVGGGTDLYVSVLDAYKRVMDTWDPNNVNAVIVISDGANDNVSAMGKEDFLAKLKALVDPAKPAPIVTIGIMEDADPALLADISKTTGGSTHLARTPAEMPKVFAEAIGSRGA